MRSTTLEPMATHLDEYVSYLRQEKMLSPKTINRYQQVIADFVAWAGGDDEPFAPEQGTRDRLRRFLTRNAAGEEPSRATWNTRLAALRSYYDYLFKDERVDLNPALRIERHRIVAPDRLPLSLEEMVRLVEAMEKASDTYRSRNVALVQVLIHSALRVHELVSLNVDQVDFDNHLFLDVVRKGNKRLVIPFNAVVAEALTRYSTERTKLHADADEPALFVSDRGGRISVRRVQVLVRAAGRTAGLSRVITPHLLRHSASTELASMGVPLSVLQGILGHASVRTTERYVHIRDRQRSEAVNAFGERWQRFRAGGEGNVEPSLPTGGVDAQDSAQNTNSAQSSGVDILGGGCEPPSSAAGEPPTQLQPSNTDEVLT